MITWMAIAFCLIAPIAQASSMSYDTLVSLIEDRENGGKSPAYTIQDTLARLPADFRSRFTLVYSSLSLQSATPLAPRAILFDDRFILTFNGDPSAAGFETLEVMEYKPQLKALEMHEIRFPGSGQRAEYSETNPPLCLSCHQIDPRPIWNQYDQWPGVYGSNDDGIFEDAEGAGFKSFKAAAAAHPRYSKLIFKPGSEFSPYSKGLAGETGFRPNLLLTKLLTRFNSNRIARLLEESPLYPKYKNYLAVTLASCPLDSGTSRLVRARLDADLGARAKDIPELPKYARVAAVLGLTPHDWDLRLENHVYKFFEGQLQISDLVYAEILSSLAANDPELKPAATLKWDQNYYYYANEPMYRSVDAIGPVVARPQEACDLLVKRLLRDLQG